MARLRPANLAGELSLIRVKQTDARCASTVEFDPKRRNALAWPSCSLSEANESELTPRQQHAGWFVSDGGADNTVPSECVVVIRCWRETTSPTIAAQVTCTR